MTTLAVTHPNNGIPVIPVPTWREFKEIIDNARLEWIYRGQANSEWPIRSSLERSSMSSPIERISSLERQLVEEFKRVAKHHVKRKYQPKSTLEWLALQQHYGTPTRLIDFTRSPYVAAFFAFENEEPKSQVSIWIVNHISIYNASMHYLIEKGVQNKFFKSQVLTEPYVFSNAILKQIFDKQELDCVIPLATFNMNQRYRQQQGLFLSPCNPDKSFSEQLDFLNGYKNPIVRVDLPWSLRAEVLRDLSKMNITAASLFPGLEGFARSLKLDYSILASIIDEAPKLQFLREKGLIA